MFSEYDFARLNITVFPSGSSQQSSKYPMPGPPRGSGGILERDLRWQFGVRFGTKGTKGGQVWLRNKRGSSLV